MILAGAALLMSAAQAAPAASVADLPGVFAQACLDGQARLGRGTATPVAIDALPGDLRGIARGSTGRVWRLASPGQTYLYVLDDPRRDGARRCGMASDVLKLDDARRRLEARVSEPARTAQPATEWVNVPDGYVANVTRLGSFTITQIRWLSAKEHRRLVLETRMLGVPVTATRKED